MCTPFHWRFVPRYLTKEEFAEKERRAIELAAKKKRIFGRLVAGREWYEIDWDYFHSTGERRNKLATADRKVLFEGTLFDAEDIRKRFLAENPMWHPSYGCYCRFEETNTPQG